MTAGSPLNSKSQIGVTRRQRTRQSWAQLLRADAALRRPRATAARSQAVTQSASLLTLWDVRSAATATQSERQQIRKWRQARGAPAYKLGQQQVAWQQLLNDTAAEQQSSEVLRAGIGAALFGLGDMVSQVCLSNPSHQI